MELISERVYFGPVCADSISWQGAFRFLGGFGVVYSMVLIVFLKALRIVSPVDEKKIKLKSSSLLQGHFNTYN